jgi:hypothetical protein
MEAPGAWRTRIVSLMNRSTVRTAGEAESSVGWAVSVAGWGAHAHHQTTATILIVPRDRLIGPPQSLESPKGAAAR